MQTKPLTITQRCANLSRCLAAAAAVLLAGCAEMQALPLTAIPGIGSVADKREVDVVLIHGMGTSSGVDWAANANAQLAEAIGRGFDDKAFRAQRPAHPNGDKIELYSGELTLAGRPAVHTHSIVWAPVVTPWKKTLCYDASDKIDGVCDEAQVHGRALANGWLKTTLLDGRLSDVVFYVSEGESIYPGVVAALRQVLAGASPAGVPGTAEQMAARDVPVFFMAESLGSKILLDSLLVLFEHPPLPRVAAEKANATTVGRFQAFFMAANQVAMLSPRADAEADPDCFQPGRPANRVPADCRIQQLAALPGMRRTDGFPVPIVAFSDRNDLLSWKLKPYFDQLCLAGKPFCDLNVVDVAPRNATAWFDLIEDPSAAHTAYWHTRSVQEVLARGMPVAKRPER